MVLEAAQEAGIYIPALCAHPGDSPLACRLCIVEIAGIGDFLTACDTPVTDGMVVWTQTPRVNRSRRRALRRILAEHPNVCLNCPRVEPCDGSVCQRKVPYEERCVTCPKNERCELQRVARFIKLDELPIPYTPKGLPIQTRDPLFEQDYNSCILCGQCVTVCQEIRGVGAISFTYEDDKASVALISGGSLKESGCRFCGACVEVCPTAALMDREDKRELWIDREAKLIPCRHACPAEVDVPRYVRLIAEGRFAEAAAVIREKVPFPAILSRICPHLCESECRRSQLNEPIAIRSLKRFAAEHDDGLWRTNLSAARAKKPVAVVGSGPAGLTAAYYLTKLGHSVTVFEALPKPGGMMRWAIPRFRLPDEILEQEIDNLLSLGIELRSNSPMQSLDALFQESFQAIFIAIGLQQGRKLPIGGAELEGVHTALSFLRAINMEKQVRLGSRVLILGGGGVACDCSPRRSSAQCRGGTHRLP